jgi:hypothetical protein
MFTLWSKHEVSINEKLFPEKKNQLTAYDWKLDNHQAFFTNQLVFSSQGQNNHLGGKEYSWA